MSSTLHLTKSEQKLFSALPEALREGWKVSEETLAFTDEENRARMRFDMMRVQHPDLLALKAFAQSTSTPDAVLEHVQKLNLSALSDNDLGELLFAVGPNGLTMMISVALQKGLSSDAEVGQFASLTEVRHGLLKALKSVTA